MVWEFPAVSQSRIEFWKSPQYPKSQVFWIAAVFGIFGLHHLYLRSPQTGLFFIIGNILTLGYWYFYDLIQLSGCVNDLNTYGLSTPFGPAGIAQGMFVEESSDVPKSDVPNPIYFLLYSLLLPILPVARLIAGDKNNAMLSLFNATNIFGWVFNIVSMFSEYFFLFFKPAELLYTGIQRTFPFTSLGFAVSGFSPRLTGKVGEVSSGCEDNSFFQRIIKAIASSALLMFGRFLPPQVVSTIQTALQIGTAVKEKVVDTAVSTAMNVASTSVKTAGQVGKLAAEIPVAAGSSLANAASMAADPSKAMATQKGGARDDSSPSFSDYAIAGSTLALLLGGFILQFSRSSQDAFRLSFGKDDSPPFS